MDFSSPTVYYVVRKKLGIFLNPAEFDVIEGREGRHSEIFYIKGRSEDG